jgi:hypothetical protein
MATDMQQQRQHSKRQQMHCKVCTAHMMCQLLLAHAEEQTNALGWQ